jgi:hypothetical protein
MVCSIYSRSILNRRHRLDPISTEPVQHPGHQIGDVRPRFKMSRNPSDPSDRITTVPIHPPESARRNPSRPFIKIRWPSGLLPQRHRPGGAMADIGVVRPGQWFSPKSKPCYTLSNQQRTCEGRFLTVFCASRIPSTQWCGKVAGTKSGEPFAPTQPSYGLATATNLFGLISWCT